MQARFLVPARPFPHGGGYNKKDKSATETTSLEKSRRIRGGLIFTDKIDRLRFLVFDFILVIGGRDHRESAAGFRGDSRARLRTEGLRKFLREVSRLVKKVRLYIQ